MSKLKNTFDQIEVSDALKQKVATKIQEDKDEALNRLTTPSQNDPKKQRPSSLRERRIKIAVLSVAAAYVFAILAFPVYTLFYNSIVVNARFDFTKARPVETEQRLSTLIQSNTKQAARPIFDVMQTLELYSSVKFDAAAPESSSTNVQVKGMDEGDIIKNDDKYIYRLSRAGFNIVSTDNGNMQTVAEIQLENFSPLEMFVFGEKLVLIGGSYSFIPSAYKTRLAEYADIACLYYHTSVQIRVLDISDIQNPTETRFYQLQGAYNTSRIAIEDGMLYFLVNYFNYSAYDLEGTEINRPYFREQEDAAPSPLAIEDIYYFDRLPCASYMIIGAIDLNDDESQTKTRAYLGTTYTTYVSGENIYTTSLQSIYSPFGERSSTITHIAKFSLSSLGFEGSNTVKGSLKDRYSMDEYNETLRVATSYTNWSMISNEFDESACAVYTFDKNMNRLDSITGIAKGEGIDSASFSGDMGYISTSVRQTFRDPVFIIDFSNPSKISISEGLKEEGINHYLKTIEGTDFVLGLGADPDGIKLQMYDMSGDEAVSVAKQSIACDFYTVEALTNPKALLYMYNETTKKGIIGFAAEIGVTELSSNYYYSYSRIARQGLYLYSFDASSGTISFSGLLSNFEVGETIIAYGYDYAYDQILTAYTKYIKRGVVIDGYLYTVSESAITSYEPNTLTKLQTHTTDVDCYLSSL